MFKKTLLFLALSSVALVSATPVAQAVEPAPNECPQVFEILAGVGQVQVCESGTLPDGSKGPCMCSNPGFKCCILSGAKAGYCVPAGICPDIPLVSSPSK